MMRGGLYPVPPQRRCCRQSSLFDGFDGLLRGKLADDADRRDLAELGQWRAAAIDPHQTYARLGKRTFNLTRRLPLWGAAKRRSALIDDTE
jgi:hypothetical protein